MPRNRPRLLVAGCLGLMLASFALVFVLILTVAIPLRDTSPIAAAFSLALAAVSFALAGTGVALAVLTRRE